MHRSVAAIPALLLAFAGCLEASDGGGGGPGSAYDPPPAEWSVGGAFTENATQDDVAELAAQVETLGGQLLVMESFPMQYQATSLTSQSCPQVRDLLAQKTYVASVGECRSRSPDAGDGDEPVSNATAEWWMGGTLSREATQNDTEDLQAEVEAHGGQVVFLETFPLQFRASGLEGSACGDLHIALAAKDYVERLDACARESGEGGSAGGDPAEGWYFGALFSEEPGEEDVERARSVIERNGGTALFARGDGESTLFASGFGEAACEASRAEVAQLPGVRSVSECNPNADDYVDE